MSFLEEVILVSTDSAFLRLCEIIERQLPTFNAPGIAIGVTHRERILHAGFFGLADRDAGQPVTSETLFQIGFISKSFTSIVFLQLQEQGLLNINDPINKYLPWFKIKSDYAPITLRHLLSHTAGIITGSDDTPAASTEAWNLRHTKATVPPGEMFHYSNSGYKVLGLVLETILGQDISVILRERIFAPLGMSASLPDIRNENRHLLATGYIPFQDDRPLPPGGKIAPAPWFESNTADGSICSTAEDMCRYIQMLLQRGNALLSTQSFEQLIHPIIPTEDGIHGEQYGLGIVSAQINHHIIGHSGGMVGFTADMLADLDSGLGVIVLTNGRAEPSKISRYVLSLFLAALDGDELPDFPEAKLKNTDDYVGTYHFGKKSFTLKKDNSRLFLSIEATAVPLHPIFPDCFIVPHPDFELFALHIEREKDCVTAASWGEERYVRGDIEKGAAKGSPAEWKAYPGHYRSHNPWLSNFRVVTRNDSLILIFPDGEEEPLHQLEHGLFRIGTDSRSPEFIRFDVMINGKSMQASFSGGDYSRTFIQ